MNTPTHVDDPVLVLLDAERAHLLSQAARIPEARQAERFAPDRWSVTDIIEHLARIDRGVARLIALRSTEPPTATSEELAEARMTPEKVARVRDRAERIEAPERVRPTGTLMPEVALAQFNDARAVLRAAYIAADPAILDGAVHVHPVVGPLTLRGWFLLTAHHDARHAQQIAELADAESSGPERRAAEHFMPE